MKRFAILLFAALVMVSAFALAENVGTEDYTRYADYVPQAAAPLGLIPGENHRTLVVWFSRVGNTVFEPDVDAVSAATLNRDAEGRLLGNAEMIAGWIEEETHADMFPIQTAYTYPSDYDLTVQVGEGQDMDAVDLELAAHLEDVSSYDTVWLVAPIWHYTVCTPLRAFLEETDLSGKTVYVMTTHCGSRFADSVEKIQKMQPSASVIRGVAVSGKNPEDFEDEVKAFVQSTIRKEGGNNQ